MTFSLNEQKPTSGGFLFSDDQPAKYVYSLIKVDVLRTSSNFRIFSTSGNSELDLMVDSNVSPRSWTGFVDTRNFSKARLVAHVCSRGPNNSIVRVKYATNDVDGSYLPMLKNSANLDIATDAAAWVDTGWLDLARGAIAPAIYLRIFVVNGGDDSVNYASVTPLEVWFR